MAHLVVVAEQRLPGGEGPRCVSTVGRHGGRLVIWKWGFAKNSGGFPLSRTKFCASLPLAQLMSQQ